MVVMKRRPLSYVVGWGRPQYKPGELVFQPVIVDQYKDAHKPKPAKKTTTKGKK
jgi:hypothetical protein